MQPLMATLGTWVGAPAGCLAAVLLATPGQEAPAPPREIALTADGFRFQPGEVAAEPGESVRFVVTAKGTPHNFTIPDLEIDEIVWVEKPTSVDVTFRAAGTFRFQCRFHAGVGMVGKIVVRDVDEATRIAQQERR